MQAAVVAAPHDVRLADVPVPVPGPGEALIRVKAVGLCGSDLQYYAQGRIGDLKFASGHILGHEVAGVAARLNIPLVDCQGFPVKTLCSQPFETAVESVIARGRAMQERGIHPELEIFDSGMIPAALRLLKEGLLNEPLHFNLVLGVPGGAAGTLKNLMHMVESLPSGCTWTASGIGAAQLPLTTAAILLGGNVRVGLEDNIYYRRGMLTEGNAPLVARAARLAAELGRPLATPDDARRILHLAARPVTS